MAVEYLVMESVAIKLAANRAALSGGLEAAV